MSISERVAPLLDDLGNALVDLLIARMEGLHLGHRLLAHRDRDLGPHRHGEVLDVDLRGLDRIEVLHEELGRVGMLAALEDRRRRDDQDGIVLRVDDGQRIAAGTPEDDTRVWFAPIPAERSTAQPRTNNTDGGKVSARENSQIMITEPRGEAVR